MAWWWTLMLLACSTDPEPSKSTDPDPTTTPSTTDPTPTGSTPTTSTPTAPPTVAVTEVSIAPAAASLGDELSCSATGSASDGASLAWSYAWTGAGGIDLGQGPTLLLAAPDVARGDEVRCEALATHPEGPTASGEAAQTVGNAIPTVLEVVIDPVPTLDVPSLCVASVDDLDGDELITTFAWTNLRTGFLVGSEEAFTPTRLLATQGDALACVVTVDDGQGGVASGEAVAEVINRVAEVAVTLSPEEPVDQNVLKCLFEVPDVDVDGDPLSYEIVWERDGLAFDGAKELLEPADMVWFDDTLPGQSWRCGVTVDDGYDPVTAWSDETEVSGELGLPVGFVALASGDNNLSGVKVGGTLWGTGANDDGQLGIGTVDPVGGWVQESTLADDWVQSTSGFNFTCARKLDGSVWCWGSNAVGALGDGSLVERLVPTQEVTGSVWAHIGSGSLHTCGLRDDGALFCWGSNLSGQLGDGTTRTRSRPVQEATQSVWVSLAVGDNHTCAVREDGTLWCWGQNQHGEVGDGSTRLRSWPVQEATLRTDWVSVAAGDKVSCGTISTREAFCWGRNFNGAVGDGTTIDRTVPTAVTTDLQFAELCVARHVSGLLDDGTMFSWGTNLYGELGNGTRIQSLTPTAEASGVQWGHVVCDDFTTFGFDDANVVFTWGRSTGWLEGVPYLWPSTAMLLEDPAWGL